MSGVALSELDGLASGPYKKGLGVKQKEAGLGFFCSRPCTQARLGAGESFL